MKAIGWIVGIILLVVVGVGVYLVAFSDSLIKDAIERFGPEYLGASVSVDAVELSLTEGSASIRGLSIGNPEGFGDGHAMRFNEATLALDSSQISETLVVVTRVLVDGADVAAVARGKKTNFQQLLDNITENTGGASQETQETQEPESDSASEMKFIIDKFDFTSAKASLSSDVLGAMDVTIPDIHLTDIGRKSNGATAAELAQQILKPISSAVTQAAVSQGVDLEGMKQRAQEELEGKLDEKIEEELGSEFKGLTDRLRNKD
jgi:hypothetical protein